MKKGQIYEGIIEKVDFPNKGILIIEDKKVEVKNTLPQQKISFSLTKVRSGKAEGRLLEVLEPSPLEDTGAKCPSFGLCGGCSYQTLSYENQLKLKEQQVRDLLDPVISDYEFTGIKGSPSQWEYRNKMEFSFGDEYKGGPLALGFHKRGSFHDIVNAGECKIVHPDYNIILNCVLDYFQKTGIDFYHRLSHTGYLRHLLVRRTAKTGEILISLITSSQAEPELTPLRDKLLALCPAEKGEKSTEGMMQGKIVGILHIINDSLADVVQSDETRILYGSDGITEELLGLHFHISTFSFFQTNSLGAEVLYRTARDFAGETRDKTIFDLYSGTGTIAQILAPVAKKVVGVEIVEEAVQAARENAKFNGLSNCEFIAGDVLKVIDSLKDKPDMIILDPPRDGIHPKALEKLGAHIRAKKILYISCKPTSLARDLVVLQEYGYRVERVCCVDMFPSTPHVETVVLMSKVNTPKG